AGPQAPIDFEEIDIEVLMGTIAFLLDHQEGHLIPTFPLARRLVERGHRVVYLTVPDGGEFIRKNGFEFEPILEHLYPKGQVQTPREGSGIASLNSGPQLNEREKAEQNRYLESLAGSPEWAELVRRIEPDLFVVLSIFPASALVLWLRFNRPILLLTPFLRRG